MTKACHGDFATNVINQIYANLSILGVNGITAENGATTSNLQETIVNGKMVERCTGKVIIIADSSKIGKTHSFTSAQIQDIDILITGADADPEELRRIREKVLKSIRSVQHCRWLYKIFYKRKDSEQISHINIYQNLFLLLFD